MYFSFANVFFPSKFPHKTTSVEICAVWVSQRHAITFLKSVKQNSNFSQTFEWQEILRRKTNKSYDKTALRNDPWNNRKKNPNLILENSMPKAIIEVYFELLVTNFYDQIFCSCHSKIVKIISILMHCIAVTLFIYIRLATVNQNVLVSYMSHKLRTKIKAQLNFVQRLQLANQKGYSNFDIRHDRHDFYHNNIWRFCTCVVQMFCK